MENTLDELTLRGLFTLKLTHAQHKQFNFLFDKLFHRSGKINGDEMGSSVIRLAVNACRMMSIVAILRSLEDSSLVKPDAHISSDNLKDRIIPRWNMVITDDDFHAVLALVEPLYLHATHVLSFLSSSVIKRRSTADKNMLFAEMEDEFTRRLLLEKRTTGGYLNPPRLPGSNGSPNRGAGKCGRQGDVSQELTRLSICTRMCV